jgi:heme A synthase
MTPQDAKNKTRIIYVLIALGFAGLIGAHEVSSPDENADLTLPFILAAAGTLCFVAAGLMARKLMKGGASR